MSEFSKAFCSLLTSSGAALRYPAPALDAAQTHSILPKPRDFILQSSSQSFSLALSAAIAILSCCQEVRAGTVKSEPSSKQETNPAPPVNLDIDEFAIAGIDLLPQDEVEEAVYPFLGPGKSTADVEGARAALEKAYRDKGYQTVIVEIPPQNAIYGVVKLNVTEGKVGRLTVNGSKYHSPELIKKKAPSVAEGKVPNFNDLQKDIVALNQWPGRKVTPALRAGTEPGTVDVDLNVEDKFPLHGSVEFNNRQSIETTPYRISSNLHYDNLWQRGDSINFTYFVAPERPEDVSSYSGSYLFRIPNNDFLSFLTYAVKSDSNVASIGGLDIIGPGTIFGERAVLTLPASNNLFHSVSIGLDYKRFGEILSFGGGKTVISTPIEYYPATASYSAGIQGDSYKVDLNSGFTFHFRGLGSSPEAFDAKRYNSTSDFLIYKGDVAYTQELPLGAQFYVKVRGQLSSAPLVSSEEFAAGGLDTVRGYLEAEALGDNALSGTFELRSPDIPALYKQLMAEASKSTDSKVTGTPAADDLNIFNEWRVYAFSDRAYVVAQSPLPEQKSKFDLGSYGVGSRVKLFDYINGSVDYAIPLFSQTVTKAGDARLTFRVWGEF